MDYKAAIERVYQHLEDGHIDKAVMTCLRIARNLNDYLYAAIFLREMYPVDREFMRILYDDTNHLKKEAQKFLYDNSRTYWLDTHSLDFSMGTNDDGDELSVLTIAVGEIIPELEQWEKSIQDFTVPTGMGQFDTAAFTDRYTNQKSIIRLRIKAIHAVKERIKTRCLNYAIRVERQLQAQQKSKSFLEAIHTDVNNYFKAHSEDIYVKLLKAAQLIDSNDPEDLSLLLTQVRRAIKAVADFFYPPVQEPVRCSDGVERKLDDEQYLNRLQEYLLTTFRKSTSRDLLKSELDYLSIFARRLNDVASKGVHADVTTPEAKQGLLGLYMFLYNVCSRLQEEPT